MIEDMIATMFLSREVAHREHLRTDSFARHEALGEFYLAIVDKADAIVEAFQGRFFITDEIPILPAPKGKKDIVDILESHMEAIEEMRYKACAKSETAIQNLIDEAVSTYLSTLYKLKRFK
jgi:hypothetical protein